MKLKKATPAVFHAIALAGGLAIVAIIGGQTRTMHIVSILSALAWVLLFSFLGWRRSDEAVQEAHKFGWFWGAQAGTVLAIVAAVTVSANTDIGVRCRIVTTVAASPASQPGQLIEELKGIPAAVEGSKMIEKCAGRWEILTRDRGDLIQAGIVLGVMMTLLLQLVGYFATWVFWWRRSR